MLDLGSIKTLKLKVGLEDIIVIQLMDHFEYKIDLVFWKSDEGDPSLIMIDIFTKLATCIP